MYGNALEEMKRNSILKVVSYIQEQVIAELRKEYSEYVRDDDISLPSGIGKNQCYDKRTVYHYY